MKTILALLTLITLTSCTYKNPQPKYSFGTKVQITAGFYKGVDGYIVDYGYCTDRDTDKTVVCYKVNADFGLTIYPLERSVNEKDILVLEKNQ